MRPKTSTVTPNKQKEAAGGTASTGAKVRIRLACVALFFIRPSQKRFSFCHSPAASVRLSDHVWRFMRRKILAVGGVKAEFNMGDGGWVPHVETCVDGPFAATLTRNEILVRPKAVVLRCFASCRLAVILMSFCIFFC